jgi:hypothetical protein
VSRQGRLSETMEKSALRAGAGWVDAAAARLARWRASTARLSLKALTIAAAAALICLCVWLLAPPLIRRVRMRRRVERVRRGEAAAGDATLLYRRMLIVLGRRGYQKPAWYTPAEFAEALPRGAMGTAVAEFTLAYNDARFGGRITAARRMTELLDELERQAAR